MIFVLYQILRYNAHSNDPSIRLKGHSTVVIWVKKITSELMVEIYSKSLSRAFGELLHIKKISKTTN